MVKSLLHAASRIVQLHKDIGPCLVRIQTGFMRDKNIEQTEHLLDELEAKVRILRNELKSVSPSDPSYLPLK